MSRNFSVFNNDLSVLAVWQLLSGPSTSHIRQILPVDPLRNVKFIVEHVYSFCVVMFDFSEALFHS